MRISLRTCCSTISQRTRSGGVPLGPSPSANETRRFHMALSRPPAAILTTASFNDAVAQGSNSLDFKLHGVAGFQESHLLQAAAVADRAGAEEFPGVQRLRARGVRDAVLELPVHVARVAAAPFLAVHAHRHLEAVRVADLVGGHQARPHRVGVVEVLALARPELPGHFLRLLVARGEVVEDGVAEDVLARPLLRDVLARSSDVAAELELEVQALGVRRPWHLGIGPADREAARMVEERPLVPGRRGILPNGAESLHQVLLETEEVA